MAPFRNLPDIMGTTNPLITSVVQNIEREVSKVLERQLTIVLPPEYEEQEDVNGNANIEVGQLNRSRRLDYVLQEATIETLNEYVFAFQSHTSYWESADTALFIAKEIYSSMGVEVDQDVPQYTLKMLSSPTQPATASVRK